MSEDSNSDGGRISGKGQQPVGAEGRITGKPGIGNLETGKIAGNQEALSASGIHEPAESNHPGKNVLTRKQRIAISTGEKGLKSLPQNFGDSDGDWQIIESEDLFETLYLDHEQIIVINPEMVKNNFDLIEKFWKEKRNLSESGSSQVRKSIEDKYGVKNLANCIKKLTYAFEQLFTLEKINEYYYRLRDQRIRNGELKLEPLLKMMVKDGVADYDDIEGIIEEGLQSNIDKEEIAVIIKKVIDARGYSPYGKPSGTLLSDQLLSVSWMSDEKIRQRQAEDEEKKKRGREIFDNVFAYSVEEIAGIIFNNEKEAKIYITNGLLKNSIDYFSPAKANQFVTIINTQKNEHLRYLQVTYRLNPRLPYRFSDSKLVNSPKELVDVISESPENFKAGKIQFKNGYQEVWLMETNKEAHQKLESIREKAESLDSAFIEFLYTFNPSLPYRFNDMYLVKTPQELSSQINNSQANWNAGKIETFSLQIPAWLQTAKQSTAVDQWNKVRKEFAERQDLGLEYFLHLLNDTLDRPTLAIDHSAISFPRIESGQVVTTPITLRNETRGYMEAELKLSKSIPGVYLSAEHIAINNVSGNPVVIVTLVIDTANLLKGFAYQTSIQVLTSEQQKIDIPVSFKIIFPKNAFMLQTAKYAVIGAAFFALVRFALSYEYPAYINSFFNSFADWDAAIYNIANLQLFGWSFLLLFAGLFLSIYYLTKYLLKK